jgi:hypothetical protein
LHSLREQKKIYDFFYYFFGWLSKGRCDELDMFMHGELRTTCKILVWKSHWKRTLKTSRHTGKDNIKMKQAYNWVHRWDYFMIGG